MSANPITSIQLDINNGAWFAAIFRGDNHPRPVCFGTRNPKFRHANYQPTQSSAIRLQRVQVALSIRDKRATDSEAQS